MELICADLFHLRDLRPYYMRNRWYEPHTGRFLSEDPIGLEGGINLYAYADADPVNLRDPLGLQSDPCPDGYQAVETWKVNYKDGSEKVVVVCAAPVKLDPIEVWGSAPVDVDAVLGALRANAHQHPNNWCARHCRLALEAGGFNSSGHPPDAAGYGRFLKSRGAEIVSIYSHIRPGDIAVFDRTARHKSGHIQIFDGSVWISDFVQLRFNPYINQGSAGTATIYRLPSK